MGAVPGALTAALKYARMGLRMYLVLNGREYTTPIGKPEERKACYDVMMEALELQDCSNGSGGSFSSSSSNRISNTSSNCCILCGESPDCAAIVLSKCGKCKQAQYCSVGCQRAHWKLHKQQCCVVTK